MTFSEIILTWYHTHKRDLPWRGSKNPYVIWISEVILQQTRIAQGIPYFERFLKQYPTVIDLANARQQEVLKMWEGLGYYSRARNMHQTAQHIAQKLHGVFPNNYVDLLKLKGVGDYTASAIASICFGEAKAVVDGNVYRVLARYFGIEHAINSTEGIKYFKKLAEQVKSHHNIRDYNQGIMEFGALQCTPKNPKCSDCPLSASCVALEKNLIAELPVKLKKVKVKNRYLHYLHIQDVMGNSLVKRRNGKGIWEGLYEFPLIETQEEAPIDLGTAFVNNQEIEITEYLDFGPLKHKLTHQKLTLYFYKAQTTEVLKECFYQNKLDALAWPKPLKDFVDWHMNKHMV